MINYPVHYDEDLGGIYDKSCHFICDVSSKTNGNEIVKRINMHNELVKSLRDMFEMAGMAHYNSNWSERYLAAEQLLERCK